MQGIELTRDGLILAVNWGVLTLLALLGLCLLGLWRASRRERGALAALADSANDQLEAYGFWRWPRWLLLGTGLLWLALFLAVILGMVWVPLRLSLQDLSAETVVDLRWFLLTLTALVAALGGLIALPFTFLRTAFNARQTRTAEQSHITDQITKAVEALGAEKEISRMGREVRFRTQSDGFEVTHDVFEWKDKPFTTERADLIGEPEFGAWTQFTETVPNREVRIGGIFVLERIAQDSLRDHVQIMEILTAYIRENAPARGLAPLVPALDPLPDDATPEARAAHVEAVKERAESLRQAARALQADTVIQAAIQVIARREPEQKDKEKADTRYGDAGYRLDLRDTNLRAVDISGLDLSRARLEGAYLEGASLVGSLLEGAYFNASHLEAADLSGAKAKRARLTGAHLEGSELVGAQLDGAFISGAHLEGAYLGGAHLEGARLGGAHLAGAGLGGAHLEGVNLGGAHLEGARLFMAHLEGAGLFMAHLEGANFTDAVVQYAAVKSCDLSKTHLDQDQVNATFGDGSVTDAMLPPGVTRPAHWPQTDLDFGHFLDEWQKWRADPEGYTPP